MKNKTYFISGHRDLTDEEFKEHYIPLLDSALKNKCVFVVGDCLGADFMSQKYLKGKTNNVIVYHISSLPMNNVGFKTIGNFDNDLERDFEMTTVSDIDLCWIRKGKERSGTFMNLQRRKWKLEGKSLKDCYILEADYFL